MASLLFRAPIQTNALITEIASFAPLTLKTIKFSRKDSSLWQRCPLRVSLGQWVPGQHGGRHLRTGGSLSSWVLLSRSSRQKLQLPFLLGHFYRILRLPLSAIKSFHSFLWGFSFTLEMSSVRAKHRHSSCSLHLGSWGIWLLITVKIWSFRDSAPSLLSL